MKNKIIEHIEELIKEHEENYFTDFDEVSDDSDWETYSSVAYDVGRYRTLTNLLNDIKNMGE